MRIQLTQSAENREMEPIPSIAGTPRLTVEICDTSRTTVAAATPMALNKAASPRRSMEYPKHISMAFVAYPFKKSSDGIIEQFIHTPAVTPGSDWGAIVGDDDVIKPNLKSFNPSFLMESVMGSEGNDSAERNVRSPRLAVSAKWEKKDRRMASKDSQVHFKGLHAAPHHGWGRDTPRSEIKSACFRSKSPISPQGVPQLSKRCSCLSLSSVKTAVSGRGMVSARSKPAKFHTMPTKYSLQPSSLHPLDKQSMRGLEK